MLDCKFFTASVHASWAMPQRPVGLHMNLSQPNVILVSQKKCFSLRAYRDFGAILS